MVAWLIRTPPSVSGNLLLPLPEACSAGSIRQSAQADLVISTVFCAGQLFDLYAEALLDNCFGLGWRATSEHKQRCYQQAEDRVPVKLKDIRCAAWFGAGVVSTNHVCCVAKKISNSELRQLHMAGLSLLKASICHRMDQLCAQRPGAALLACL